MSRSYELSASQRGTVLVEFALCGLLLVTLLLGVIDLAMYGRAGPTVRHAAAVGARLSAVLQDPTLLTAAGPGHFNGTTDVTGQVFDGNGTSVTNGRDKGAADAYFGTAPPGTQALRSVYVGTSGNDTGLPISLWEVTQPSPPVVECRIQYDVSVSILGFGSSKLTIDARAIAPFERR